KWFNPTKGYGFIRPSTGEKDVFVHISAVERAGLSTLNEGQTVEYELVTNRGKTSAENLKGSLRGGEAGPPAHEVFPCPPAFARGVFFWGPGGEPPKEFLIRFHPAPRERSTPLRPDASPRSGSGRRSS